MEQKTIDYIDGILKNAVVSTPSKAIVELKTAINCTKEAFPVKAIKASAHRRAMIQLYIGKQHVPLYEDFTSPERMQKWNEIGLSASTDQEWEKAVDTFMVELMNRELETLMKG